MLATFEVDFVDPNSPAANDRFDLVLNIVSNVISLFQQLLECENSCSVLQYRISHLTDGLSHIFQAVNSVAWLGYGVVDAGIHVNVNVVFCKDHLPIQVNHVDATIHMDKLLRHRIDVA